MQTCSTLAQKRCRDLIIKCASVQCIFKAIRTSLASLIKQEDSSYPEATRAEQKQARAALHVQNHTATQEEAEDLKKKLPQSQQVCMEQTSERGASLWLTTIPLSEYGFTLHKQAFKDALCLRYGWRLPRLPSHCLCGETFNQPQGAPFLASGKTARGTLV